jgi:decaprenylphospho-beta-D-erythro-pentofuranosid-2-ulose 2-reductase
MNKILIIGACSAIAQETAKCFARDGFKLYLADLNIERLETVQRDLLSRFQSEVFIEKFDANDFSKHELILNLAENAMGGLDAILIAYGTLPDQQKSQQDVNLILKEFALNGTSVISLTSYAANFFEQRKNGCIAVISSVAGDRGRRSNFIYGAAKGAVSLYLQGLRSRLLASDVKVVTIKPGLVDTPMTANLKKNFLFASSKTVGEGIYKAILNGNDIVYIPGFWRMIMMIVKLIPERIFKKLNF